MDIFSGNWVGPVDGGMILTNILFEELSLIQKQQTRMEYCMQLVNCQFSDPWLTCVNKWIELKNKWPFLDLMGKQLRSSNVIRCLLALLESGIQFTCYVKSTIAMLAQLTDNKARNNLIKELLNLVVELKLENSDWYFEILIKADYTTVKNKDEVTINVPPIKDIQDVPARERFFTTLRKIQLKEKPIYFQHIQQCAKDKEEILKWLESFEYISESVLMELRKIKSKNEDFNSCLDYFFQTINFRYKFKDQERYEEWLKSQMRDARPAENLSQQLIKELENIEGNLTKEMEVETKQNIKTVEQNVNEIHEEYVTGEIFTINELREEKQKNWIFPKQILNQIRSANKIPKPKEYMHMKISEKSTKETLKEFNKSNN